MLLTAARLLVVEARGHEEALLGCSRRQSPLVRRKDGDHQRRELALDLLMKEGEEVGRKGEGGMKRERGRKGGWRERGGRGRGEKKKKKTSAPLASL